GLDIVVGVGQRERARKLQDRALRAGIHVVMFAATQAIAGGDIDNLAALALDHMRNRGARAVELAREVRVDAAPPILVSDLLEALSQRNLSPAGGIGQSIRFA